MRDWGLMEQKDIEKLYLDHRDDLYDYLVMHIKDHSMAEDILQDIFFKISKENIGSSDIKNMDSYLFITARNTIIDYWRKASVSKRVEKQYWENIEREKLVYHYPCIQDDREIILKEIIPLLTDQQKTIFLLNRDGGYSYNEIADKMNLSRSTVKNHMVSALKKIRIHMANNKLYCFFTFLVLHW